MSGNLPYDDARDHRALIDRIKSGERPSRPKNPDGARWLQDGVWDMVMACWNKDPGKRWEVSAMLDLLQALSLQEVLEVRSGNRIYQGAGNRAIAETSQTSKKEGSATVGGSVHESRASFSLY